MLNKPRSMESYFLKLNFNSFLHAYSYNSVKQLSNKVKRLQERQFNLCLQSVRDALIAAMRSESRPKTRRYDNGPVHLGSQEKLRL